MARSSAATPRKKLRLLKWSRCRLPKDWNLVVITTSGCHRTCLLRIGLRHRPMCLRITTVATAATTKTSTANGGMLWSHRRTTAQHGKKLKGYRTTTQGRRFRLATSAVKTPTTRHRSSTCSGNCPSTCRSTFAATLAKVWTTTAKGWLVTVSPTRRCVKPVT